MNAFEQVAELCMGHVVEVSGSSVRVELAGEVTELTRSYQGRVYQVGQVGSVVKIHFGRRLIFGFVTLLRMRSEEQDGEMPARPVDAEQRVMDVDLFAEGTWNSADQSLTFRRGVTTYPLPRQGVYLLTREEATRLYSAAEGQREISSANPMVPFARYVGADAAECRANIDKMFGLHCAVLGSTGSGKSCAVAALLHSALDHRARSDQPSHPRIIIIDPHGEYGVAFGQRGLVYRAYDAIGAESMPGTPIALPYWLMSSEEFRSLVIGKTEAEATSQNNIILKAITHARMVTAGLVAAAPSSHGSAPPAGEAEIDEPRPASGRTPGDLLSFDADRPLYFSLDEFTNHARYLQAARRSSAGRLESIPAGDFDKRGFRSVLDKLAVLRRDPRLRFLMNDSGRPGMTLGSVIEQLIGVSASDGSARRDVRVLDMSGLPNEVAGPLAAALARLLFQYKLYQTLAERDRDPILLVCEEAHRYVPDHGEAQYAAAQTAVRRIAREGRKYGIGLMLVSQRPADVEGTVISQCGTWLILRLSNATDQQHVQRFLPDGLTGLTKSLPALSQQEALFVGEGAALPARVKIRDLRRDQQPRSQGVSFATGWSGERLTSAEISQIAARMQGRSEAPERRL